MCCILNRFIILLFFNIIYFGIARPETIIQIALFVQTGFAFTSVMRLYIVLLVRLSFDLFNKLLVLFI
jgi:hypothetical protein